MTRCISFSRAAGLVLDLGHDRAAWEVVGAERVSKMPSLLLRSRHSYYGQDTLSALLIKSVALGLPHSDFLNHNE